MQLGQSLPYCIIGPFKHVKFMHKNGWAITITQINTQIGTSG